MVMEHLGAKLQTVRYLELPPREPAGYTLGPPYRRCFSGSCLSETPHLRRKDHVQDKGDQSEQGPTCALVELWRCLERSIASQHFQSCGYSAQEAFHRSQVARSFSSFGSFMLQTSANIQVSHVHYNYYKIFACPLVLLPDARVEPHGKSTRFLRWSGFQGWDSGGGLR